MLSYFIFYFTFILSYFKLINHIFNFISDAFIAKQGLACVPPSRSYFAFGNTPPSDYLLPFLLLSNSSILCVGCGTFVLFYSLFGFTKVLNEH